MRRSAPAHGRARRAVTGGGRANASIARRGLRLGVDGLRTLGVGVIAAVFPARCAACGRSGAGVCASCLALATPLPSPHCRQCNRALDYGDQCARCRSEDLRVDQIFARYVYAPPLSDAVQRLKYSNKRYLASTLASLALPEALRGARVDAIVPIPLAPARERDRGYNQSRLLAAKLSPRLGAPLDDRLLIRQRDTLPQARLPRAQRLTNVRGAFRATRTVGGARILLVDDVATTGATVDAAARALKRRGAAWVGALVMARQPDRDHALPVQTRGPDARATPDATFTL